LLSPISIHLQRFVALFDGPIRAKIIADRHGKSDRGKKTPGKREGGCSISKADQQTGAYTEPEGLAVYVPRERQETA